MKDELIFCKRGWSVIEMVRQSRAKGSMTLAEIGIMFKRWLTLTARQILLSKRGSVTRNSSDSQGIDSGFLRSPQIALGYLFLSWAKWSRQWKEKHKQVPGYLGIKDAPLSITRSLSGEVLRGIAVLFKGQGTKLGVHAYTDMVAFSHIPLILTHPVPGPSDHPEGARGWARCPALQMLLVKTQWTADKLG